MSWSHIAVGTDGSDRAGRAVVHAAGLARAMDAQLTVVTTFADRRSPAEGTDLSARTPGPSAQSSRAGGLPADLEWAASDSAGAEEIARRGAELARQAGAGRVRTRTVAATGPAEGLARAVADLRADLLVVGSKGMTGAARFLTGSVPNELSHHVGMDLLIVRTD